MSSSEISPSSRTFRVDLPLFCGPLDLLLYLVRKNEMDLTDIPIAKITEQYLAYLQILEVLDIDAVGDFIALAATLIEMKSEEMLPQTESTDEEPIENPRDHLVKRLLEYKEYREAATVLEERSRLWQRQYPRFVDEFADSQRDMGDEPIMELELWDLVSALARVLRTHEQVDAPNIRYDDTPIHVYVERILERLRKLGSVTFTSLFQVGMHRSKIVGIFLAILELARHHGVQLTQDEPFGEIMVTLPTSPSNDPTSSSPSTEHASNEPRSEA